MNSQRPRRLDLHDLVRELTQTTQHRQLYMRKRSPRYHTTTNPPLLVQLDRAAAPRGSLTDNTGPRAGSRPSANIDAIDTAIRIHTNASTWLRILDHDQTGTTVELVRRLAAVVPGQDQCGRRTPQRDDKRQVTCCTYHRIEADIRRWWTWARITTGWDLPPWQPNNTCPLCGSRGTIRIRAVEKLATCINDGCRETWDEATFGLLVEHIRAENGETQAAG